MSTLTLRACVPADHEAVNRLIHAAWAGLAASVPDWNGLAARLGTLVEHAGHSEVIVAEQAGRLVGVVGYVGPHQPKAAFFPPEWPIVRLLSVAPDCQAAGVGQALVEACLGRARRDGASVLALHTSPVMDRAGRLYRRLGFTHHRSLPPMFGIPYEILIHPLD